MNTTHTYIVGVLVILLGSLGYSQGMYNPHINIWILEGGKLNIDAPADLTSGIAESGRFAGMILPAPEDDAGNTGLIREEEGDTMAASTRKKIHNKRIMVGVLKAVSLGMSACSLTMGTFGVGDSETQMTMLGLGVFALAIASIQEATLIEVPIKNGESGNGDGINN